MFRKNRTFKILLLCITYSSHQQTESIESQPSPYLSSLSDFLSSTSSTINDSINYYLQKESNTSTFPSWIEKENSNKQLADLTKTKITHHPNRTQTIDYFDLEGKNIARTELNVRGFATSITNFNADETQTKTTYNTDKTQTINIFDAQGQNRTRIEIDIHGNPTKSVNFNTNNSQIITIYNPDKTQTVLQIDTQGQTILKSRIFTDGTTSSASSKLLTAWHEAGHALSRIFNDTLSLIKHITIQPDAATNSQGHVLSMQTYQVDKSVEELENQIISALCGGVAEQVLMSEKMLTNPHDILKFLAEPQYASDLQQARKDAREIVAIKSFQYFNEKQIEQKIDALIIKLYKRAYQFIVERKNEIKKTAEILLKKNILSSDETYNLLQAEKPLMAYEEGPLPLSLFNNYKYRGWNL